MTPRGTPVDASLRACEDYSVGLSLSGPISDRLDALVALTEAAGERTTRKELIASLVLAAPAKGEALATVLKRYRQASVGEALLRAPSTRRTVHSSTRKPGPRPRRAS